MLWTILKAAFLAAFKAFFQAYKDERRDKRLEAERKRIDDDYREALLENAKWESKNSTRKRMENVEDMSTDTGVLRDWLRNRPTDTK